MPARLLIGGEVAAEIVGYEWRDVSDLAKRAGLSDLLNAQRPDNGPTGDDPDPDATEAARQAALWGDDATWEADEVPPGEEDRVY